MEQNLTRREARENAFLAAFSATFHPDDPQPVLLNQPESHEHPLDEFSLRILRDMEAHSEEIDDVIRANLKGWTIARVPRVSLVALRVALAEMMYGEEKKTSVAINEAVELVKKYGSDKDYQFVNGLLGTVARAQDKPAGQPGFLVGGAGIQGDQNALIVGGVGGFGHGDKVGNVLLKGQAVFVGNAIQDA